MTWGGKGFGGDSSAVQDQLTDVVEIQRTRGAFAAIRRDGSVVTWGSNLHGGDSSGVKDQLVNVDKIAANICSFAAIRHDGSVVTWGVPGRGGDSSAVQDQLKNVRAISASVLAFSAILLMVKSCSGAAGSRRSSPRRRGGCTVQKRAAGFGFGFLSLP